MELEKKKRKVVDLNMKRAIVKHLDEGHNIKAIVDKFSVSKGTIKAVKENTKGSIKQSFLIKTNNCQAK
jgi:transposase